MGKDLVRLFSQPDYLMQAHSYISGHFMLRSFMVKSHCPAQGIHYYPAVVTMFEVTLYLPACPVGELFIDVFRKAFEYLPAVHDQLIPPVK